MLEYFEAIFVLFKSKLSILLSASTRRFLTISSSCRVVLPEPPFGTRQLVSLASWCFHAMDMVGFVVARLFLLVAALFFQSRLLVPDNWFPWLPDAFMQWTWLVLLLQGYWFMLFTWKCKCRILKSYIMFATSRVEVTIDHSWFLVVSLQNHLSQLSNVPEFRLFMLP